MKTLCIFVHFSENNDYSEDDIHYISTLITLFENVVVLSSNDHSPNNLRCKFQLNIPNYGVDFGKIQWYLNTINVDELEHLYIFNNSCILIRNPKESIAYMEKKNYDFWGYNTSNESDTLHIQSYFYYFKNHAILEFNNLLNEINPFGNALSYVDVIPKLEIPMLNYMHSKGFNCGVYLQTHLCFPNTNPVLFYIDKILILNVHFPFIKKKSLIPGRYDRHYLTMLANLT